MTANPRSTSTRNARSRRRFSNNVPPGLHYLPPLDPKKEEFLELFRSFLSSKDERTNILALSEEDARFFIEIIDRAFRAAKLDAELRNLAFSVLRKLCGRIGHLPESYLLSEKLDLPVLPYASGGFADVRMGVFKRKNVAVKSLRISEQDDKTKIRKHFCKEVAMWKNLSHPNVLNLIGIPDTLDDGKFSMISEWMANGNIMEYVRKNAGNYLKLLSDAVEGLKYLHNANIVHGDLKGANILITNTEPVTACLADFGFMTVVHDPSLGMESSKSEAGGGTTPFMAPELLVPSRFGLDKCTPSKEADVYAIAMVVYQVLTGTLPFGKLSGSEVVFKVVGGGKPSKPANALEVGLSDNVWKLLEDCWQTQRTLRPSIRDVSSRVRAASSLCGMLSPVGGVPQRHEDPQSDFNKFDRLFLGMTLPDDEDTFVYGMDRLPSQESILTDTSTHDSLFSKLSDQESTLTDTSTTASSPSKLRATESSTTGPSQTSTEALAWSSNSKGGGTDALSDALFAPALNPTLTTDPVSRSSTPGSEATVRPRLIRDNSTPYRDKSNGSSRTLLPDVTQREQLRSDPDTISTTSTVAPRHREAHAQKPSVSDLVASSFLLVPDTAAIALAQAKDGPTYALRRPPSMLSLCNPRSRPAEPDVSPQTDDNGKHKRRHESPFHIRRRLGRALDPILRTTADTR